MPRPKSLARLHADRVRGETLARDPAQEILELLARRPDGLTVLEIVGRFRKPAKDVIRAIAVLQRRGWLRTDARGALTMGDVAPAGRGGS
jgi:hypothetical protein